MKRLLLICSLGCCLGLWGQQKARMSDLDLSKSWQEYGEIGIGKTATGEVAEIGGKPCTDAIGLYGKSNIKIDLKGDASVFRGAVGIADTKVDAKDADITTIPLVDGTKLIFRATTEGKQFLGKSGKNDKLSAAGAVFIVKGDGKELFRSNAMKPHNKPADFEIDVTNVRILELEVEPVDKNLSGANALWISPEIEYASKAPETVDPKYAGEGPEITAADTKTLSDKIAALPKFTDAISTRTPYDWLLTPEKSHAEIYSTPDGKGIVVANGMVARTFRIFPNLATIDLVNRMTGESMLRAVSSEGSITIDGKPHAIGGLDGQPERSYLRKDWIDDMTTTPESFVIEDFRVDTIAEHIKWARNRWALNKKAPTGKEIVFTLRGDKELSGVKVRLYVSVFDNIPVICKRFEVENGTSLPINIDSFKMEYLGLLEPYSHNGGIHVESDFECKGTFTEELTDITENWVIDPLYNTQRSYGPSILDVSLATGPDQEVAPGATFSSYRTYLMPFDSYDRERKGLFTRRFYKTVAPWTTENPIFLHLTSTDPQVVRTAVDQCAETGYEMIILSFGSGLNAEDISEENIAKFKSLVDYAKSKGIEMGCYSLLASRWISDEVDVINPATGKRGGMTFGSSPCLSSDWGYEYFHKIKTFVERTGMMCFEHDGSYPGDVCASTSHSHHKGLNDSQWNQFHKITELYHWMREKGIYLNVPDFYFLQGSTKVCIGYRESNWSLPRDRQLIHTRQLNYDCTWERPQSALWSFVPLVQYQGGGEAATIEPLKDHLYEYRTLMFQNYGAGVQACYRGPRLYDSSETKQVVVDIINWYKKYRDILNSDIIHLRKPDARDWDGIMHVSTTGKHKALAMIYNPTDTEITREITLPLYYTGLKGSAQIREKEGAAKKYTLDSNCNATLSVTIPAGEYTWLVAE